MMQKGGYSGSFGLLLIENEICQVPVCYYVKNDILMRKGRPPDVLTEDE